MYSNLDLETLQRKLEDEYDNFYIPGSNISYLPGVHSLGWAGYYYEIKREEYILDKLRAFHRLLLSKNGIKDEILTSEVAKKINTRHFVSTIRPELLERTMHPSRMEWFLDIHEVKKYLS